MKQILRERNQLGKRMRARVAIEMRIAHMELWCMAARALSTSDSFRSSSPVTAVAAARSVLRRRIICIANGLASLLSAMPSQSRRAVTSDDACQDKQSVTKCDPSHG